MRNWRTMVCQEPGVSGREEMMCTFYWDSQHSSTVFPTGETGAVSSDQTAALDRHTSKVAKADSGGWKEWLDGSPAGQRKHHAQSTLIEVLQHLVGIIEGHGLTGEIRPDIRRKVDPHYAQLHDDLSCIKANASQSTSSNLKVVNARVASARGQAGNISEAEQETRDQCKLMREIRWRIEQKLRGRKVSSGGNYPPVPNVRANQRREESAVHDETSLGSWREEYERLEAERFLFAADSVVRNSFYAENLFTLKEGVQIHAKSERRKGKIGR